MQWVFVIFMLSSIALGYPINRLLGPAKPFYLREYAARMLRWYEIEYGSFRTNTKVDSKDLEILDHCLKNLEDWGLELSKELLFASFWFSHSIKNDQVSHRTLFCRLNPKVDQNKEKLKQILKGKISALSLDPEKFWGLSVNADSGEVDLQWLIHPDDVKKISEIKNNNTNQLKLSEVIAKFDKKLVEKESYSPWIYHLIYKKNQLLDQGVTMANRELPISDVSKLPFSLFVIGWVKTIFLQRPELNQIQLKDFNLYFLSDPGQLIGLKHLNALNQYTLFLDWKNKNQYQLFYP